MTCGLKEVNEYLKSNVLTRPFGWQDMEDRHVIEVPEEIESIIQGFDQSEEKLAANVISAALGPARTKLADNADAFHNAWPDAMAFALQREAENMGPWNTYFGAWSSGTKTDGSDWYGPDVRELTPEVIEHWEERAKFLGHPVLKGRYADLVWEFSRPVSKKRTDPEFARIAIDSYLDSVEKDMRPDQYDNIVVLKRAARLAASINDAGRIARAKDALLDAFDKSVADQSWWWSVSDELLENRKLALSEDDRERLRAGWETLFAGYAAVGVDGFDPHHAESVGDRLIGFYRKAGASAEVERVAKGIADAFIHISLAGSAMQAMAWLETSIEYASVAGDKERAKALKLEREEAIRNSRKEMQSFTTTMTITKEEVDEFLAIVVDKDRWQQALFNIALEFTEPRERLWISLQREARAAPLMAMFSSSILADDHQAAIVGSTEDDKEGNLIRRSNTWQQLNRQLLARALDETVDFHRLSPEEIASFIFQSDLFDDFPLMREGIKAWMNADYIKALFTLVPLVESGIRTLAKNLGEVTTKAKRGTPGWEVSSNLGDFLAMDSVQKALGPDIILQIKSIFADARGTNLRNLVAHGLASSSYANWHVCDLIVHTLLVMGVYEGVRDVVAQRGAKDAEDAELDEDVPVAEPVAIEEA
ncbi:DUF4209 domain-containing protein [Rhizobium sp. CF142]|uniref:DUF4209 domain-containing protein n=1 Tax=Rhizobium sp. CF142 TaxID=1144314 RepID=UPI00026EFA94|nr:DUF4209 domain-containing protein [Rhizobium sp. CF142]EJJ24602.1 hypothetical protein PMI11_07199 [Rhizobium sp. CF142]